MAQFSLTVTVPDNRVQELLDALVWKYPQDFADPNNPTGQEARAVANRLIVEQLRKTWSEHRKHLFDTGAFGDGGITE